MLLEENKTLDCIIVGSYRVFEQEDQELSKHSLEELSSLAHTLGLKVRGSILLNLRKINPSIFYGKGQIESLCNKASSLNCKFIIFNDEITPAQFKNIQKIDKKKTIFDRTGIILEIFKNNAKTRESKFQVELASLQYMLPRLTGQWTHLERQMGGTGTRGGPGEKQIEIDRRLIGKRITKLKKDLDKIKRNRRIQSYSRKSIFRVSLAGYTNAGKSSLLNSLSKPSSAYVENKLFATLETTTRNVKVSKSKEILLTDTVGLIRDLPHDLVASFRSTFEEVRDSDLILITVDASSTKKIISEHISTIMNTLKEMKIKVKNSCLVFNKIDLVDNREKIIYLKKKYPEAIFISAKEYIKIDELLKHIYEIASQEDRVRTFKVPHNKIAIVNNIYKKFEIESRKDTFEHVELVVRGSSLDLDRIEKDIEEI